MPRARRRGLGTDLNAPRLRVYCHASPSSEASVATEPPAAALIRFPQHLCGLCRRRGADGELPGHGARACTARCRPGKRRKLLFRLEDMQFVVEQTLRSSRTLDNGRVAVQLPDRAVRDAQARLEAYRDATMPSRIVPADDDHTQYVGSNMF